MARRGTHELAQTQTRHKGKRSHTCTGTLSSSALHVARCVPGQMMHLRDSCLMVHAVRLVCMLHVAWWRHSTCTVMLSSSWTLSSRRSCSSCSIDMEHLEPDGTTVLY